MKKILSFIILFILFVSCNENKSKSNKVENTNKVVSNSDLLQGWRTYDSNKVKVNIPSDWKPKNIEEALLYIPISEKPDLYYVVLNYNTDVINIKEYLKKSFGEVLKKNSKVNYTIKEINFKNNNKCYTIELFTIEENVKYKIYTLIYQVGNQIYDFSYKTLNDEKTNATNYQTFYSVVFSFEYDYDNIVDGEKFIVDDAEVIKYEDL